MKTALLFFALLVSCSSISYQQGLLDSSGAEGASLIAPPELRLGDVRYLRNRLDEREELAWYFTRGGAFQLGSPRDDQDVAESVEARIYEVGEIERGKYRGAVLERWDVEDGKRSYHHYFLRSPNRLVHLERMTKGEEAAPLWQKGARGQEVLNYLWRRWGVSLGEDSKFHVKDLDWHRRVEVPGEGIFTAAQSGKSFSRLAEKSGTPSLVAVLPRGKEAYRVPGGWLVYVYPDGLAVLLKKE
jgi:hypothetical protein